MVDHARDIIGVQIDKLHNPGQLGRVFPEGRLFLKRRIRESLLLRRNFLQSSVQHLAVINKRNSLLYSRQRIDVELEVFNPPQSVPFFDGVLLFTINHHIKGGAAGQMTVDGIGGLANRISLAKEGLKI